MRTIVTFGGLCSALGTLLFLATGCGGSSVLPTSEASAPEASTEARYRIQLDRPILSGRTYRVQLESTRDTQFSAGGDETIRVSETLDFQGDLRVLSLRDGGNWGSARIRVLRLEHQQTDESAVSVPPGTELTIREDGEVVLHDWSGTAAQAESLTRVLPRLIQEGPFAPQSDPEFGTDEAQVIGAEWSSSPSETRFPVAAESPFAGERLIQSSRLEGIEELHGVPCLRVALVQQLDRQRLRASVENPPGHFELRAVLHAPLDSEQPIMKHELVHRIATVSPRTLDTGATVELHSSVEQRVTRELRLLPER